MSEICRKCRGFKNIIQKEELLNACYCSESTESYKVFTQSEVDELLKQKKLELLDKFYAKVTATKYRYGVDTVLLGAGELVEIIKELKAEIKCRELGREIHAGAHKGCKISQS